MKSLFALTGGISCGKSAAETCLKEYGIRFFIDTDAVCHELYENLPFHAAEQIRRRWGDDCVSAGGKVSRTNLSAKLFGQDQDKKLAELNAIIHPEIKRVVEARIREYRQADSSCPVLVAVPLLFECGWEKEFDAVITVWSSKDVQLERMMKNRGFSEKDALNRINAQISTDLKLEKADFGLINNSSMDVLRIQCEILANELILSSQNLTRK